jgi:ankyrin repeat protein
LQPNDVSKYYILLLNKDNKNRIQKINFVLMSAIRSITIRIFSIVFFLFITGIIKGQWRIVDTTATWNSNLDTSDYIPSFYNGALDYNLMIASSRGYSSEIIRLMAKGADINSETNEGATPLVFAVSNNNIMAVLTLLSYKPLLNETTKSSETPLLIAVKNGYPEIAEALIRAGADVDIPDKHGATPLHHASLNGYLDIVDMLLYYDASMNIKSVEGTTPLLAAIWAGYQDVADLLIQRGANIEEKDNDGFSPFLLASYYGDTLIMDILYKKGADIYTVNNAKINALGLAIISGKTEAAEYLFKIGNKWSETGNSSVNLYDVAAKYRSAEMLNILKKHNIPGNLKHEFDQVDISLSSRFFLHDMYTGASLSLKEPYLNAGFVFGCDTKFWYTRVLMKNSENLFYQYMDKGSVAYAGLFKEFPITSYPDKFNYSFSTSLVAAYSFGNKLKGTLISADNKFNVIPEVSLKMTKMNFSFNLGMEYLKTEYYHVGPVWIRLGVSYNYYFDNLRTKVKPIRWY